MIQEPSVKLQHIKFFGKELANIQPGLTNERNMLQLEYARDRLVAELNALEAYLKEASDASGTG